MSGSWVTSVRYGSGMVVDEYARSAASEDVVEGVGTV